MSANDTLEVMIEGVPVTFSQAVLDKYNQPGPRYTSYPTAPEWNDSFGETELRQAFREANAKPDPAPLSLYFHIPFCESLCLYCGCNVIINKRHEVALPYLDHMMRGMRVSDEDKLRRSLINRILCHTVVVKSEVEREFGIDFDEHFAPELVRLRELERDGLVRLNDGRIEVAPLGRVFIRNVAMAFDEYLNRQAPALQRVFSKTL